MVIHQVGRFNDLHKSLQLRTNMHMCNNIEKLKIINEKLLLEIVELKSSDNKSEKKTNVTQSLQCRQNVNNDLQERERNTENGQIEDNQKTERM